MKILILGAAGEIGQLITSKLLHETQHELVLYARNASSRLQIDTDYAKRVTIVDGDFFETEKLIQVMSQNKIDLVYLNDVASVAASQSVADAMTKANLKRIIVATIASIYDEIPGKFGQWNEDMLGKNLIQRVADASAVFEQELFDYTLLRLIWLYNQEGNTNYVFTQKGEPFTSAQLTRQAAAQAIFDVIEAKDNRYIKKSLGVGEPNTNWDKPSFYKNR